MLHNKHGIYYVPVCILHKIAAEPTGRGLGCWYVYIMAVHRWPLVYTNVLHPFTPLYAAHITRRSYVTTSHMVSQWLPFINTVIFHLLDALYATYVAMQYCLWTPYKVAHIIIYLQHITTQVYRGLNQCRLLFWLLLRMTPGPAALRLSCMTFHSSGKLCRIPIKSAFYRLPVQLSNNHHSINITTLILFTKWIHVNNGLIVPREVSFVAVQSPNINIIIN